MISNLTELEQSKHLVDTNSIDDVQIVSGVRQYVKMAMCAANANTQDITETTLLFALYTFTGSSLSTAIETRVGLSTTWARAEGTLSNFRS